MRFYFVQILLIVSLTSYSQNLLNETDITTSEFKFELVHKGINDFFSIKKYCIGYVRTKKPNLEFCKTNGAIYYITYVFWKESDKYWIKKLDNCGEFEKVQISDSRPMEIFTQNIKQLESREVKPYQVKADSITNGNTFSFTKSRSHSCFERFKFHQDDQLIKLHFDIFNLTSQKEDPNINYKYNNDLEVVKISKIVDEIISSLENKNKFIR